VVFSPEVGGPKTNLSLGKSTHFVFPEANRSLPSIPTLGEAMQYWQNIVAKTLVWLVSIGALLWADIESCYAQGLVRYPLVNQEAVFRGPTAMLSLRIPFGAESQNAPAPRLTLGFGTSWQDAVGLTNLAGYRFVPTVEAGFTLSGEPVLQLGPIDLLRELRAAANEGAGETTGGGTPTWVWWAAGLTVVVIIAVIASPCVQEGGKENCGNGGGSLL